MEDELFRSLYGTRGPISAMAPKIQNTWKSSFTGPYIERVLCNTKDLKRLETPSCIFLLKVCTCSNPTHIEELLMLLLFRLLPPTIA